MLVDEIDIAKKIVSQGYFSKEIPNEFSTIFLGEHISKFDLSKSKLSKNGLNKWSKLIDFSIPKIDNFRRIISIPHPLHYILLAKLLEENWEYLNKHFRKSQFSLTSPQISDDESIKPKYKMSEKINRRLSNLVTRKYILQVDITRYYPSIYTHSISWALHTKEVAKLNTKDDSYIGNNIDNLVRNMQDGQTIGIPIGPVTSLIIQEIIGTAIDDDFRKEFDDSLKGFRYTDDMEYYFSSSEEAEKALNILNKILNKYGLDLNMEKTKIIKIPQILEPEWVYYFKKFKFRYKKDDKPTSIAMQRTDIKEYFSKTFKFKIETNEKGILNYAIKILRKVVVDKENWDIFESLLLQSILVDSSTIPTVFEIIESYKYRGYPLNWDRIIEFINTLIQDNIELKNDFEVSWALSFANKLNIQIDEDVSNLLLENDNAIINILVMILDSKKLLSGTLDFSFYENLLNGESLYDSSWIFKYECSIQGWLGNDENIKYVKNNNFFAQLLNYNISFICPNYSKVREEVRKSIILICLKYYKSKRQDISARDILSKVIEDYIFSLDDKLFEEIINQLEIDIEKLKLKETQEIDRESESKKTDRNSEETPKKTDGDPEETQETDRVLNNNDSWLSNFLTTNITKTPKIRAFKIDHEY